MNSRILILSFIAGSLLVSGCNNKRAPEPTNDSVASPSSTNEDTSIEPLQEADIDFTRFSKTPTEWGETVTGVKTKLATTNPVIALTFDACGGEYGSDIDSALVDFLTVENIPATLFINERWIDHNEADFAKLAANPLFQIENHGTTHRPLSVTGEEAWGIRGTDSIEAAFTEVAGNHNRILAETGRAPTTFRSGTAHYDDVAVAMVNHLGLDIVGFTILGDAGATYTAEQVEAALLAAPAGSIVILHMNQPTSGTAEGVQKAIPQLQAQGFSFVLLQDYPLE